MIKYKHLHLSLLILIISAVKTTDAQGFFGKIVQSRMVKNAVQESGAIAKIVGGSIAAACIYGIANDQVSARVCPEYFTQGFHRKMIEENSDGWLKRTLLTTKSPTKLGLIWGTIATWWMGGILSIPITLAARFPLGLPKIGVKELVKPTGIALAGMGAASLVAGVKGYIEAQHHKHQLHTIPGTGGVPHAALTRWYADAKAHEVAYTSGTITGLLLTGYTLYKRFTKAKN
jgi:hypothetical protein